MGIGCLTKTERRNLMKKKIGMAMLALTFTGCAAGKITPGTACDIATSAYNLAEAIAKASGDPKFQAAVDKAGAEVVKQCGALPTE